MNGLLRYMLGQRGWIDSGIKRSATEFLGSEMKGKVCGTGIGDR